MKLGLNFQQLKQRKQIFRLFHGNYEYGIRYCVSRIDYRTMSQGLFTSILRDSTASGSLRVGQMAHGCILRIGLESDLFLSNNLLHMYCSCGPISTAFLLFDGMLARDVVSWNTIISGLVGFGLFGESLCLFREMRRNGFCPSQSSFASVLVATAKMVNFGYCQQIHGESLKCGLSSNCHVGNSLMSAYLKCGEIKDARNIFDRISTFDEISVEILLGGYIQDGNFDEAFHLFRFSIAEGVDISCFTFSNLVRLCSIIRDIEKGTRIHGHVVKLGLDLDVSTVNSLITFYARLNLLDDAMRLFCCLKQPDVISWNSLIGGHAFNNLGDVGLVLVGRFLFTGIRMKESTFSSFLSCCATVTVLENAKKAHALILKLRDCIDQGTSNIILTMYCRCGSLHYANDHFMTMEARDAVAFNLLIRLFRDHCLFEESIKIFCGAQLKGFTDVDEITYSSIISSCAKLASLEIGHQIHSCIVRTGFESIFMLRNSLLEMYSVCRSLDSMEKMFVEIDVPDQFSWNILIMGYARCGIVEAAIGIWEVMRETGVEFNGFSFAAMVDICDVVGNLALCEQMQAYIIKSGLIFDTALMNSLLTMYANHGMMKKACTIFNEIHYADSISWNSMISAYAQNGFAEECLNFYLSMTQMGLKPNHFTFVSISKSCATLANLALCSQLHSQVIKRGFDLHTSISNAFITMYARCGGICESSKIFQSTTYKDVITWNSMLCGYAYHGYGKQALEAFYQMKSLKEKPNEITFVGVLSACSHAGLIHEAWELFSAMTTEYGIIRTEEHYSCMVDILSREGKLSEAKDLIESMPFDPCSLIWKTLLRGCKENENMKLGEVAAERIMQAEPHDSAAYVLLSDIYNLAERREDKAEMRKMMKDKGVEKEAGCSWI